MSFGRVEPLALELVEDDGDGAVVLRARDAPRVMLAGDEPALAVAGVAVGIVGGPAEVAEGAGNLVPFHDPVVGDVAAQQVAAVAEPDRPLGPAQPGGKALHRRQGHPIPGEAGIEDPDRGIGIVGRGLPHDVLRRGLTSPYRLMSE